MELSGRGITACSLRLSWLDAGRGAVFLERRREAVEKRMPIGRLVRMDEAVETVLFLLSASASSVNGTVVTLDGGLSATKTHFEDRMDYSEITDKVCGIVADIFECDPRALSRRNPAHDGFAL